MKTSATSKECMRFWLPSFTFYLTNPSLNLNCITSFYIPPLPSPSPSSLSSSFPFLLLSTSLPPLSSPSLPLLLYFPFLHILLPLLPLHFSLVPPFLYFLPISNVPHTPPLPPPRPSPFPLPPFWFYFKTTASLHIWNSIPYFLRICKMKKTKPRCFYGK